MEVLALPAATPELQLAERRWPLLREAVANQAVATLDDLEDTLVERCLQRAAQSTVIQHATNYHWLPTT